MRKIGFFFILLISIFFSVSCERSLAEYLNEEFKDELQLVAPRDRCFITIYEDEETSKKLLLDLGEDYSWDEETVSVSFEKLMKYPVFSEWYEKLGASSQYSKVGIYNPETGGGFDGEEFTVTKKQALSVLWNYPLEKVRIYANNGYDVYNGGTEPYYDFQVYVPFGETLEITYEALLTDSGFMEFLNKLGNNVYSKYKNSYGGDIYSRTAYPAGFVDRGYIRNAALFSFSYDYYDSYYSFSDEVYTSVAVSRKKDTLRLGWTQNPTFSSLIIESELPGVSDCIVNLGEMEKTHYVSYSSLMENETFAKWYNSLEKTGYVKAGLGYSNNSSACIYEDKTYTNTTAITYENRVLHVIWLPVFDKILIHANNGSGDIYQYNIGQEVSERMINWYELSMDEAFIAWYEGLTNGSLVSQGLCNDADSTWSFSSPGRPYNSFSVYGNDLDVYVFWTEPLSFITLKPNNGTSDDLVISLDKTEAEVQVTWEFLCSNPEFENWYNRQTKKGYTQTGLSTISETKYCYLYPNDILSSATMSSSQSELYIVWIEAYDSITIYANNGTNDSYEYKFKSIVTSIYVCWNDLAEDENFINWYNGLVKSGYVQNGLSRYENGSLIWSSSSGSTHSYCDEAEMYVHWY